MKIVEVVFVYENKEYFCIREYDEDETLVEIKAIESYFFEGNMYCDCNRSLMIEDIYDINIPELECNYYDGIQKIKIKSFIIKENDKILLETNENLFNQQKTKEIELYKPYDTNWKRTFDVKNMGIVEIKEKR